MRFLLSLIAGLVLVGVAPVAAAQASPLASSAPSASATSQPSKASFGAGPASATKIDGRPYFTYDASPNGVLDDHIAVVNFATRPQTLNVYTVDAVSGTNGAFVYEPRSAPRKQVGAWLSVGTQRGSGVVTVGPRSKVILPVYLHVPANASPGDHVGAVIVSLTSQIKSKGKLISFEQRIATRVIIRVSGPLRPQLSIKNLHARYSGHLNPLGSGTVAVSYTVVNTGNALLSATQQVSVHGLFGSVARAVALPGVPLLLPGGSYRVSTRVPGVFPEISITATVRLAPQGLPGDLNPPVPPTSASVTLWAVPWLLLVILVVLVLVIVTLIWRRRRRSLSPVGSSVSQFPQGVKP